MEKATGTKWYVKKCARGVLCALVVELCALLAAALLLSRALVGEGQMDLLALIAAALGAFAGCLVSGARTSRRLEVTAACAAALWAASLLLGMLFCAALDPAQALRLALAIVIAALCALAVQGRGKRRHPRAAARRSRR